MIEVEGKIKRVVFHNPDNGYLVAKFKIDKSSDLEESEITIVGKMMQIIDNFNLRINGNITFNEKYNTKQFEFINVEQLMPSDKEKIIEFLTSSLIKGCGKKTAEKLYNKYKNNTLEKIKKLENITCIEGISEVSALKINSSILKFALSKEIITKLQDIGFSIDEASKIYFEFKDGTLDILEKDFYALNKVINFKKLDSIYVLNHDLSEEKRIYACALECMKTLSDNEGDTYYTKEMITSALKNMYSLFIGQEDEDIMYDILSKKELIVVQNDRIYLKEYYDYECFIANKLNTIYKNKTKNIKDIDDKINNYEKVINIEYDYKQKEAIKSSLSNNITIISGGPGTGKTTILKSIVNLYIKEKNLGPAEICTKIALLAPTGRASKKMSQSSGYGASTIHKFLKWDKESDTFEHNEFNKVSAQFIVIDECSMIDIKLFASLLTALKDNVVLILVGDAFQLPPVRAGLVFNSLIETDLFNFTCLSKIYRQSDDSYIPDLALSIKEGELTENYLTKKDDYNFLICEPENIHNIMKQAVYAAKLKGIDETNLQVLAPMYKGLNGIDSFNNELRNIFNPPSFDKNEITYNGIIYREKDKVLQLVNDIDKNIFNGDIGYIKSIKTDGNKVSIKICFEEETANVDKAYFKNLTHAYAMSIHKSQGSEFEHVIMPITKEYYRMMYNKLLYTGVSRAKASLILIGSPVVFNSGVNNNLTSNRKTYLKEKLLSIILENE